jgi:hypothetical protein
MEQKQNRPSREFGTAFLQTLANIKTKIDKRTIYKTSQ